jgi:sarcosine oxidase subunit alpha
LRSDTARADRKQLVGLLAEQPREVLPEGSQILEDTEYPGAARMQGHVTSSYFSACLDRSIALALVRSGSKRTDEIVQVSVAAGRATKAKIVKPVFIDPEGARQNE